MPNKSEGTAEVAMVAPVQKNKGKHKGAAAPSNDERSAAVRTAFQHLRSALEELERVLLSAPAAPADLREFTDMLPAVRREVMKPREYAEYMRVNVRKVHAWIKQGMPHFLVEGRIRIRVEPANAWLQEHSAASQPDA